MSKNYIKKTLAGIFALAIVASSTPIAPFVPVMDSNSIIASAETAPETDFVFNSNYGMITGYTGEGGDIEIPSTIGGVAVTGIFSNAFFANTNVTGVIIPEGVTSIGEWAFGQCANLKSVTIPDSVTSIGNYAFTQSDSLTTLNYTGSEADWNNISINSQYRVELQKVDIIYDFVLPAPETDFIFDASSGTIKKYTGEGGDVKIPSKIGGVAVTSIGGSAFQSCKSLTSVTIPEGVTAIGNYAFQSCTSLTSVTIPEGVTEIGNDAFLSCQSLTSVTIPEGVTRIAASVFSDCASLISVTIPEGVTAIGNYAFRSCTSLTSVTIPESVTSIDFSAFQNCTNLTSVTIPEGVTAIGNNAFGHCRNLTSVTAPCTLKNSMSGAMDNRHTEITYTHPCTIRVEDTYKVKCACGEGELDYTAIFTLLANEGAFLNDLNADDYTEDSLEALSAAAAAIAEIVSDYQENKFVSSQDELTDAVSAYNDTKDALELKDADYTAVENAKNNVPDDLSVYTTASVNALNAALDAVEYDLKADKQNEVEQMARDIEDAIDGLKHVAYTAALEALIEKANAAKESDYSADVWAQIDEKVATGNTYIGADLAEEEVQIDIDVLVGALTGLLDQKLADADYSAVYDAITEANNLTKSNYTEDSWAALEAAFDAVVYDLKEDKQDDVKAMAKAIENATNALVLKAADYTEVDKYIAQAENIDRSLYTDDTVADLDIATCAVARGLDITHQDEVQCMADAINDAIAALVLKDADYKELEAAIDDANGYTEDNYTADSWATLQNALAEANAVDPDLKADQQGTIDTATDNLRNAIADLEEKPQYETLYENYLVKAPTVNETGTYNQRAYHYEGDAKVVDNETVFDTAKEVSFEQWYLRTMVQYKEGDDSSIELRFVSMLDENLDDYKEAGFIFKVKGDNSGLAKRLDGTDGSIDEQLTTTTANTSFIVDGETVDISKYSESDDYFFIQGYTFTADKRTEYADRLISVTAYVLSQDDEVITGVKTVEFTINQLVVPNVEW